MNAPADTQPGPAALAGGGRLRTSAVAGAVTLGLLVVGLWVFPGVWYNRVDNGKPRVWLRERSDIPGWSFKEIPVDKSAERILVADKLFNAEFRLPADRAVVNAFSAKRYSEKRDEIGLFMHTPDRCWTDAGWHLEPVSPDVVEFTVNGVPMRFERRVFVVSGHRELTYFGGLVGGQPVPYRLDHNLSIGTKRAMREAAGGQESLVRVADTRFWWRIWQGLVDRNPLVGPKQFVRVSTEVLGSDIEAADRLLREFLGIWLEPSPYEEELSGALAKKS